MNSSFFTILVIPVGPVRNVVVAGKLYSESSSVFIQWQPPLKTNGQDAKTFQYVVEYCESLSCMNTTKSSSTSAELSSLSAGITYHYSIYVFDTNMVLGMVFNATFTTAARGESS